jgi:hypothetical protein
MILTYFAPESPPAALTASGDYVQRAQARHYLALEARQIVIVRLQHHEDRVDTGVVELLDLADDILGVAQNWQGTGAKHERLERKRWIKRAALREEPARAQFSVATRSIASMILRRSAAASAAVSRHRTYG